MSNTTIYCDDCERITSHTVREYHMKATCNDCGTTQELWREENEPPSLLSIEYEDREVIV